MTLHERLENLDEEGSAYQAQVTLTTGETYARSDVLHHSHDWLCLTQGAGLPELWLSMAHVVGVIVHMLP